LGRRAACNSAACSGCWLFESNYPVERDCVSYRTLVTLTLSPTPTLTLTPTPTQLTLTLNPNPNPNRDPNPNPITSSTCSSKKLAAKLALSDAEKADLFCGTAKRVYGSRDP